MYYVSWRIQQLTTRSVSPSWANWQPMVSTSAISRERMSVIRSYVSLHLGGCVCVGTTFTNKGCGDGPVPLGVDFCDREYSAITGLDILGWAVLARSLAIFLTRFERRGPNSSNSLSDAMADGTWGWPGVLRAADALLFIT
jgi:hypothetical protein